MAEIKFEVRRLLTAMACVGSVCVNAQTPPTPDAGSIMQTLPLAPVRPGTGPTFDDRVQKARPIGDVEGLKVDIKSFRVTGLTVIGEAEVQAVLEPYLGPEKKFQDLLDATSAVKKLLAGKGFFLADAIVPEQAIKDGVIEILVLEGRMGTVKLNAADDVGISPAYLEAFLSKLQPGSVIETSAVERAVFLLSDLKGIAVRTIFEPGEKIGTANLIVQVTKARLVEGSLDFDANGSVYTGVYRVGGGVDFNNAAGLGDMLSLRYSRAAESSSLSYQRASYLVPLGSSGLKVGFAYSDLDYRLGTPTFEPLKASGKASVQSALAAYPIIRSRNLNLIATGQMDGRKFRDRQETTSRFTDKNAAVNSIGFSGDVRDAILGGGISVFNLFHTRGKLSFMDQALLAADKLGHDTNGIYEKTNLSFSRMQSVTEGVAFYFAYSQQVAGKNLDSSEKFSLGGQNAVRAYAQGEGSGDEGWIATGELRFRIPTSENLPGNMVFAAFYDAGGSRLNKNPISTDTILERKIAGVGFGLNWEVPQDWSLRTSVATRQTAKGQSEHVARDPRVYMQASKYF